MTQTISASAYFEEKDRNAVNTPMRVASTLATDYTGVREYIGARYVPIFADPVEWNQNLAYEPLTIVTYAGNSYTSRQYVPKGVLINNTEYWVPTGNFNGQLELYRKEVADLSDDLNNEVQNRTDADTALSNRITTNANAISTETTNRQNADTAIHNVLDKLGVAVTKVDFINTNGADQWGIKFTFSDGKERLLYCGEDFIRYFDSTEQNQLWTIDAFHTTYDVKTDMRVNYRNNIAFVNLTGFTVNWPGSPTREWFQIATAAELKLTFPPVDPTLSVSHYYAVFNTDYESTDTSATCRLGADGLWVRYSSPEPASFFLYGQIGVTATAYRTSTRAVSEDVYPDENGWVILVDDPSGAR